MSEWLQSNRLSLNIEKTSFMLLIHSNTFNVPLDIRIGGNRLNRTSCIRFLGVTIDDQLIYNAHVKVLSKKLSCVVGVMKRNANCLPPFVLRQEYFSLFQSAMEYGVAVWGGCGLTNRAKIARTQNRVLKLLSNFPGTVPLPLTFERLYTLRLLCKFENYLNSPLINNKIHHKVVSLILNHSYGTRFHVNENINLPRSVKTVSQKQFFFKSISDWNKLPVELRQLSGGKFKVQVRRWLVVDE